MVLEKRYFVEIWVRKVPCCDETAAIGRCYHRNSDREKRRFATTFPHPVFQKPRFHRGFSRAEQKKNTCFSIKTPHCPTPEAARRPCELAVYVNHCQDFCNTVKPKKKGSTLRSGLPMGTRSTENAYHVCRITKSHYNMEPVAM